ncbi:pyruvate:ferredoxin oxidoreductase, gamma subunit PorG [Clostridium aceticum]|uniref:Pyruvate:ferredoxin oxidoreductase, gamma subunit PorG n=1 Tax=Clostridium aceticum TaxID=84022 RepID=A0A0D8IAK2_9CLOT|nr:2-oxoacid:acceptor oxidoreductase family protein [Clostridium aceticum]AKL95981.1 pyruvate:ferredoxin oxidoreductase, gamma subunit PorG [Clostridium aceticum]KJF27074.1 ferredoxin oxidoreductase [Clostridium aceticum]
MSNKISIRMSGLGGQGVVTAAHILGSAATQDGKNSTVNPFFGAEKRLAPAESYVRISSEQINERGEILSPNIIMIFHPHVITMGKSYTMPFFDGLQPGGTVLINSDTPLRFSQEEQEKLTQLNANIFFVSATQIATDIGGTELSTNMAMLGGLMGIVDLVTYESLSIAIQERFGGSNFVASGTTAALDDVLKSKYTKTAQLVEKNMKVMESAAAAVKKYAFKNSLDGEGEDNHVCFS